MHKITWSDSGFVIRSSTLNVFLAPRFSDVVNFSFSANLYRLCRMCCSNLIKKRILPLKRAVHLWKENFRLLQ